MPEWSDNGPYLLGGLLAFWLPILAYWLSLRSRAARLTEEEELLHEEAQHEAVPLTPP